MKNWIIKAIVYGQYRNIIVSAYDVLEVCNMHCFGQHGFYAQDVFSIELLPEQIT